MTRRGVVEAVASPLSRHLEVPNRRSWPLVLAGVDHIQKNCWKGWLTSQSLTTAAPPGAASRQVLGVAVLIKNTSTTWATNSVWAKVWSVAVGLVQVVRAMLLFWIAVAPLSSRQYPG